MGFSLGSITHAVSKAVKSVTHDPGNILRKAGQVTASTATGAATGFASGGFYGAIAGGSVAQINAIQAVSKEHTTRTSRLIKESAGFGALAGVATGAVVGTGAGGYLATAAKSTGGKLVAFGKSGGLTGNFLKYGATAVSALKNGFGGGKVPGSASDANPAANGGFIAGIRDQFGRLEDKLPAGLRDRLGSVDNQIRDTLNDQLRGYNPQETPNAGDGTTELGLFSGNTPLLIIGIVLALVFFRKK